MIDIKEKTLIIKIDEQSSRILTSALSALIYFKKNNTCTKIPCIDCQQQGTKHREVDTDKLAKEILDLYYDMYKISMSTTKIPTLQEVKESIINP